MFVQAFRINVLPPASGWLSLFRWAMKCLGGVCPLYRKVCRILAKPLEIFLYNQHNFFFPNYFRVTLNHIQSPWRCRQHTTLKSPNEDITLYCLSTQNTIIWINVRWSFSLWSANPSLFENLRIITIKRGVFAILNRARVTIFLAACLWNVCL